MYQTFFATLHQFCENCRTQVRELFNNGDRRASDSQIREAISRIIAQHAGNTVEMMYSVRWELQKYINAINSGRFKLRSGPREMSATTVVELVSKILVIRDAIVFQE